MNYDIKIKSQIFQILLTRQKYVLIKKTFDTQNRLSFSYHIWPAYLIEKYYYIKQNLI